MLASVKTVQSNKPLLISLQIILWTNTCSMLLKETNRIYIMILIWPWFGLFRTRFGDNWLIEIGNTNN